MKVFKIMMYIIELLGVILYFIINYFANTNVLVMKEALYTNNMISAYDLSGKISFIMLIVFFILVAVNMILMSRRRYKCVQDIYFSVLILVSCAAAVKCFNVRNLFTYYYLLITMAIILACEIAKIFINLKYKVSNCTKI